jgi:hypothetical protein
LFFDAATGLWVACTAAAVHECLSSPALLVRPLNEPVPRALQGRPSGQVFGGLMRMNEGASSHDEPKARASAMLPALAARAASIELPRFSSGDANNALFDAPLVALASLLGLPRDAWSDIARDVRRLVAGWAAGADESALVAADEAALSLLERFHGDANRIGFFTQTCDATAGLVGSGLVAWQRDASTRLDAEGLAAIALRDPSVQNTRRFAADHTTVRGHALKRGDAVLVLLASANHDEVQPSSQHAWGQGRHACPGEQLSRQIAARVLAHWLGDDAAAWREATSRWRYRPLPNARIPEFL